MLRVSHEKVDTGGVRLRLTTTEAEQPLRLDTLREHVEVERVAIGKVVEQRREPWHDGDTLVVPIYEERVVVQRTLVLKEEVRLHSRQERHTEEQVVVVRRDRVVTERRDANGTWSAIDDAAPREPPADILQSGKEST